MDIPKEIDSKIDAIIAQYPKKKSAAMMCMHLFQETFGYFDDSAIRHIASRLEVEPIEIYGMVSFYPMFTQKPRGRIHIKVCRTLSCALAGSYKTASEISKAVSCPIGETSDGGIYTLEFVECLGNCVKGPNVQVNDKLFDNVTPDRAEKLVDTIKKMDSDGSLAPLPPFSKPAGGDFDSPEYKG